MTTRYVGAGGSDSNNGTSWATRKLTLNGAEDTPVVAGDTVYVGPGTYRELLTVDVSGTNGNPISYIGDYDGSHTDGVGGVVRITGSDNDTTTTRSNCISATTKNYRVFKNILVDMGAVVLATSCQNWTIQNCILRDSNGTQFLANGATQLNISFDGCFFVGSKAGALLDISHSSTINDCGHTITNCIFWGVANNTAPIQISRVGGMSIKNSLFFSGVYGVLIGSALAVGQTTTVNNCIFQNCGTALAGTVTGEITEDYNTFWNNATNRSNTSTGANSIAYPPHFDSRWFFQLTTAGAGPSSSLQIVSPFDLASYSQLVNLAGTSPTVTDMRGTAVQGAQREWGALEYDSTLKIKGSSGISRSRAQ